MKNALLLSFLVTITTASNAQVPIIDYGFLVDDPDVVVNNVLVQPDGKILVGGYFPNYAGSGHDHLVRLNNDGTIDPTFNPNGTGPGNAVEDMVLMPDGRILIAGNFLTYNGSNSFFIARLQADGTLDNTFTVQPNSINGAVWAIELHDNHKVLAGGEFFICSGESRPHIVQFNDDGSVDSTFVVGTGFDHNVHDILVLPDMRVAVGGQFTMYNGTPSGHIALLSPQGPIDPTMDNDPGLVGGGGIVRSLALQPDGKLLAGGYFQYHDGQARSAVERLNLDGTHDPGFTSPLYAYSVVRALAVQADGKILVGGEFTSTEYANAVPGPERLVRVLPDGTRDTSFGIGVGVGPGTQTTGYVHTLAVQPDSKILVGGHFETVDTETQFHQIVRLLDGSANDVDELTDAAALSVLQDLNTGGLFLRTSFGGTDDVLLQLHGPNGQLVHTERVRMGNGALIPLQVDLRCGLYLVSLTQGDQRVSAKVILE